MAAALGAPGAPGGAPLAARTKPSSLSRSWPATDDDIVEDGLSELVYHYARAVAIAPSAAVYDELLSARSFAGTLLGRASPRRAILTSSWPPGGFQACWHVRSHIGEHGRRSTVL